MRISQLVYVVKESINKLYRLLEWRENQNMSSMVALELCLSVIIV